MERQIIEQAAELGISDKVFFPGFLRDEEQHQAYAAADVFVMPSVSEPFGITALEAMRAGVPVIISKQSGVAEAVENVVRVDFWDTEKLARHLNSLLDNAGRREALGNRAREEAASLTWLQAAERVRDVADDLLGLPVALTA